MKWWRAVAGTDRKVAVKLLRRVRFRAQFGGLYSDLIADKLSQEPGEQ